MNDDNGADGGRSSGVVPRGKAAARRFGVAVHRGFLLVLQAPVLLVVWTLAVASLLALAAWVGVYAVPPVMRMVGGLTALGRWQALHWDGVAIDPPRHRPLRPFSPEPGEAWRSNTAVLADPVTWRDLAWLTSALAVGFTVGGLVLAFAAVPFAFGVVLPLVWWFGGTEPLVTSAEDAAGWIVFAVALLTAGCWLAPRLVEAYGALARSLLTPPASHVLTAQVEQLRRTRADVVDTQALEMRRIERDLHDGAQSRLVTLALTLGEMEHMLGSDRPDLERARQALDQARSGSAKALQELRDLVRGIHPPVLADRGLADAVRALAMDSPMTVHVSARMPGRPHPAVESAVYFAVTELLTNAVRHGEAQRVQVVLEALDVGGGTLRVTVTDDGCGGADPTRGSGLAGIERRLAALDGRMALDSPRGGPTMVTLDVPGAWPTSPGGS